MIHRLRTIDAHAAGEPLRLIVEGFPTPRGKTMLEKRAWVRRHSDDLRKALMLEPRGHADMYGAVLTEPVTAGADAGVLFMHNEGYSTMCGHGVIAVVTIALERGLLTFRPLTDSGRPEPVDGSTVLTVDPERAERVEGRDGRSEVVLDSPAGRVVAMARLRSELRVESVAFVNVPAFVLLPAVEVKVGSRQIRADVAFGGAFYAVVDSESAGLPLDRSRLTDLRRVGMEIKKGIESAHSIVHPGDPGLNGIYGTIFTGPPQSAAADLRNVTVFADAEVDRSPCGTGTCAVMAILDAMGLLSPDRPFVHESIVGSTFRGRVVQKTKVADYDAIVPEVEGSAWITGEHTFLIDEKDPFREGFRL
ncbi:MAG: proline racemase family protein [Acidobacteria bacterium]|nr:proline racemase family protein [Acidobacteriota bacterium]